MVLYVQDGTSQTQIKQRERWWPMIAIRAADVKLGWGQRVHTR